MNLKLGFVIYCNYRAYCSVRTVINHNMTSREKQSNPGCRAACNRQSWCIAPIISRQLRKNKNLSICSLQPNAQINYTIKTTKQCFCAEDQRFSSYWIILYNTVGIIMKKNTIPSNWRVKVILKLNSHFFVNSSHLHIYI